MALKTFFFDTYAFYEIIGGNINYKPYLSDVAILTTKLNLMELYYGLLLNYNKATADKYYDKFSEYCIDFDDDVVKQATLFRLLNKERNLSYVDSIGYVLSKSRNIKFLTGDKEFKDMENVEYVK